jgi:hypothetical protein
VGGSEHLHLLRALHAHAAAAAAGGGGVRVWGVEFVCTSAFFISIEIETEMGIAVG